MSRPARPILIRTFVALALSAPLGWAQSPLSVSPNFITFRAAAGQFSPLNLTVTLVNSSSTVVNWQAPAIAEWLKLPVASGSANPGANPIAVQAAPAGLPPGIYAGGLSIAVSGSNFPVVTVAVRLQIDATAPVTGPVTVNLLSSPLPMPALSEARSEAQAAALADGRVLITGGLGAFTESSAADIYSSGGFTALTMNGARRRHTATLLASGDVLLTGGMYIGAARSGCELFHPGAQDSFLPAAPLLEARYSHAAVRLPDNRVLVIGGYNVDNSVLASTELYDPGAGSWQPGPALNAPRALAAATSLADGRVLVTGGVTGDGSRTATAEILDPAALASGWKLAAPLAAARQQHTATLLPKGQVLVAGGWNGSALASSEIYDPAADSWTAGPPLANPRYQHAALLLPAGVVLIVDGWQGDSGAASGQAEVYNPASGDPGGAMMLAGSVNPRALQAAVLLPTGQVLTAGGTTAISAPRLSSADLIWVEALQTTPAASLAVNPNQLSFSLTSPSSAMVTISNAGAGTMTWTAAVDQPWVTIDNAAGMAPAGINVKVNASGLAPGNYKAALTLASPEAVNSPVVVPISLVSQAPAVIVLSAQSISLDAVSGVNAQTQMVLVTNGGGGTLTWSVSSSVPWMVPDPPSGSAPGATNLNLNTANLLFGVYQGQVTFSSREAVNGLQTINVTVRVLRAPQIGLTSSSLDLVALPGRDPDPVTIPISNTSGVTVGWTAASSQPWLQVSSQGTAPGYAIVQVASHDLPLGHYEGEIDFTVPGASNSPRSLWVYLEVREGFEPFLGIFLNPGFYIVEATLDSNAPSGWWGIQTSTAKGALSGGFIQGGPLWGNGDNAATCAFSLPARTKISVLVTAQATAAGFSPFGFTLRVLDANGKVAGSPATGSTAAQLPALDLLAGSYTAEVRTTAGSPLGAYQFTLTAPTIGNVNSTGYLTPGAVGFGAFYVPEAQTVKVQLLGHQGAGPWGAGDMVLTLKDISRKVLRIVDRTGTRTQ